MIYENGLKTILVYNSKQMPKIKTKGKDPPLSNRQLDEQDTADEIVVDNEVEGVDAVVANACVKLKLNTFSVNKQLNTKLRSIVLDMNQLLGEGYVFANFHILRILHAGIDIPKMDRNFYYRCLVAVSENKSHSATLGPDLQESKNQFDALRDPNTPKIVTTGHIQVVADLSISMATMATNHLWMNIKKRLQRFLSWSQPTVKLALRKRIIEAVLFKPTVDLSKLFTNSPVGLEIATNLRAILKLPSNSQFANRAHLLIPMYFHILKHTIIGKAACQGKKFGGRTFTLLPLKSGYTISHIQFSAMALLGYLKQLKLEKFSGDGRKEDASMILKKYFNTNLIETKNRKFGNRIITDGVAVSVFMHKKCALVCPNNCPCEKTLKDLHVRSLLERENKDHVRVASVDPGFTDVATTIDQYGVIKSYSSKKYYETALYNMSARRTNKWNNETLELTSSVPDPETDNLVNFKVFVSTYLNVLPKLLKHRSDKGYRNMRFLRFQKKQQAIKDICEMIAPLSELSVVGFGDWNGGNGTPIGRRCAGPLQEIKLYLSKCEYVVLMSIDEYLTSKRCSDCGNELCNMRAKSTIYKKKIKTVRDVGKIHKILHCRSSQAGTPSEASPRCGTTWNRDVNAAKNILNLTILQMQGLPRPQALMRKRD